LILTALAQKARGSAADAIKSLHGALELGEPGGYLRAFLDEGAELAPLLRHAAARGGQRDYAQRVLAELDGAPAAEPLPRGGASEALSEREVEVLRLVAAGLANREIGERLFISEKTVKTHLSNILGKLGAANRTQAVEQAHRLGLL
jgi:LuxR family maltose regulon positive regulatory protein